MPRARSQATRKDNEARARAASTQVPRPDDPKLTPMLRQFAQAKYQHPDALLFFRMGDFYELFYGDAVTAADALGLALTTRDKKKDNPVAMAGVPHHAAAGYISRLVSMGHKVAVCDQVENPADAKGLVRRQVTRVVTPGLVADPDSLEAQRANYLAAVAHQAERWGLAYIDVSTGEFRCTELPDEEALTEELLRVGARELLLAEGSELARPPEGVRLSHIVEDAFHAESARRELCHALEVADLAGFGIQPGPMVSAAGALLFYMRLNHSAAVGHITGLHPYDTRGFMGLDESTRRNLELFSTMAEGKRKGSLIGLIDRCRTSMGSRLLRAWLAAPLVDVDAIRARADAVEAFSRHTEACKEIRDLLREVSDVERLNGRLAAGAATPRDLTALRRSLSQLPELNAQLKPLDAKLLGRLPPFTALTALLMRGLVDDPPARASEGGYIRPGFNEELDEVVELMRSGRSAVARMEAQQRKRTGITSLKIRYNQVFGYYLEVTKANLSAVPADYVRRQTLANSERYITPELKEFEARILGAEDRRRALEQRLLEDLRAQVSAQLKPLAALAEQLARLDVLANLAEVAGRYEYVRPVVDDSLSLDIDAGRHPVIERMGLTEPFVANDVHIDCTRRSLLMITGPNMAGKSTFMRQVALITLLAQIGSFVPARKARIGVCDRIFTRVGASDNLARGQSTFMVEMTETANILHNASQRSLVVMDEIGRGTSTYDGVSIAWAVAEDLHDRIGARTLFATHYHELTELAARRPRMQNMNVSIAEKGEQIIFLRKIREGGSSRSYGIQVARLAGLPRPVVGRAHEVLGRLEVKRGKLTGAPEQPERPGAAAQAPAERHGRRPMPERSVERRGAGPDRAMGGNASDRAMTNRGPDRPGPDRPGPGPDRGAPRHAPPGRGERSGRRPPPRRGARRAAEGQIPLFSDPIRDALLRVNLERTTPIQALLLLSELREKAAGA